jgi:hypothetical protein
MSNLSTRPGTTVRIEATGKGSVTLRAANEARWDVTGGGAKWRQGVDVRTLDDQSAIAVNLTAPTAPTGAMLQTGPQGDVYTEHRGGTQNVIATGGAVFAVQGGTLFVHGPGGETSKFGAEADDYEPGSLVIGVPAADITVVTASASKGSEVVISGMDLDRLELDGAFGTITVIGTRLRNAEYGGGVRVVFDEFSFASLPEDRRESLRPLVRVEDGSLSVQPSELPVERGVRDL